MVVFMKILILWTFFLTISYAWSLYCSKRKASKTHFWILFL